MRFLLTPISMTLDDLTSYKLEFSWNFASFRRFVSQTAKQMKIDPNLVYLSDGIVVMISQCVHSL